MQINNDATKETTIETIKKHLSHLDDVIVNQNKLQEMIDINPNFHKFLYHLRNCLEELEFEQCTNNKFYSKIYVDVLEYFGAKQIFVFIIANMYYNYANELINSIYYQIGFINESYTYNMQVQILNDRCNLSVLYRNIDNLMNALKNDGKITIENEQDLIYYCIAHTDTPDVLLNAIKLIRNEYPDDELYIDLLPSEDLYDYSSVEISKKPKFDISITNTKNKDNVLSSKIDELQKCKNCLINLSMF